MSELYHHLLIPKNPDFLPAWEALARLYPALEALGALAAGVLFNVVTFTGKQRPIGRNPKTGEEYYGPELKIHRGLDRVSAMDAIRGESAYDVSAEATGPTEVPPFALYSADNYETRVPGPLWQEPYPFSVRCRARAEITHVLHSAVGGECETKPEEPAFFKNPWTGEPIHSNGPGCARFWIDIGIGSWLMPRVTDHVEILNARFLDEVESVFGTRFTQGCSRTDD